MARVPTTVAFPRPLPVERDRDAWRMEVDGRELRLTNLDKVFWPAQGYTKGDLVAYYYNAAERVLPYLAGRPLTMKRMPDGAEGEFFYAKQAPDWAPDWITTAPVRSRDSGKVVDYVVVNDTASLLWLANLGCIELHAWHGRADALGHPDYAFFDLDPMGNASFDLVCDVALLVHTVLDQLALRSYPRTSGATGLQVYVPIDRVHTAATVTQVVERICRLIQRADPERTTMAGRIADRGSKIFLDHVMNTEGRNIATAWSVRPEPGATVATPLTWEEVEACVSPAEFTIETVWDRPDHSRPILEGGQDLRAAMRKLGVDPALDERPPEHELAGDDAATIAPDLSEYSSMRDFTRTAEPAPDVEPDIGPSAVEEPGAGGPRFVLQHHLATRLHHDLRLEHHGVAASWAVPKGLPDVKGLRHLAVQTEDHPIAYMTFEGEIPQGEYGGGPVRIWDSGTYELLAWSDDDVKVRLHGRRHDGEWHLFRTDGKNWLCVRSDEPRPDELPPLPPRYSPMLATDAREPFDDAEWLFEIKWDGVRSLATVVRPHAGDASTCLVSRAGNDITAGYPELGGLWERVLARNAVLDGEIVVFGPDGMPSFQLLQQRMHLREPRAARGPRAPWPVTYFVFDVLAVDGRPTIDRTLDERLALLDDLLVPGMHVRRSEPVTSDGTALFAAAKAQGLEGVVAKRRASPYRPGKRTRDWRKVKHRRTANAVIGGWLPGEGARSGTFGALLLGAYDEGELVFVGRAGTGFNDAELAKLERALAERATDASPFAGGPAPPPHARWVRPELVCGIEYGELTDGGVLRAPAYKGLVAGADPRTCLREDL